VDDGEQMNRRDGSDPRAIIGAFYEEIWNCHDKSRIPDLLDERLEFRGSLGAHCRGHADFAAYVDSVHAALGDYRCDIRDVIVEDDRAFARMSFSGVHRGEWFGYRPTGKRVEWAGAAMFTFTGDRIVSLWVLGDLYGLMQQLAKDAG
jgi:predicted ester cyclase